ncbi:hypothetical protein [Neobacillus citreus]|uniref:Uncharacterized protein n=1 Tax=Neobacillus citreus TaxID=2833578 RepID=A0A9J6MV84_9BACI|nr:hypothetical protein [Neobacillus citreus]MCH6266463.1 hypothetical protein [Neobacillus citreus]
MHNRKFFPYLPQNELISVFNRKTFAYFTFADYSIKDKASYLMRSEFFQENGEVSEVLYK